MSSANPDKLDRPYRFGFILSTSLGNMTRYMVLRKYAELDKEVEFIWAPVKHFIAPGEKDSFKFFPKMLKSRAVVIQQSLPVLRHFSSFDAVMIHMYEVDLLTAIRSQFRKGPVRVISTDDAPAAVASNYPHHPVDLAKPAWRRRIRFNLDVWRARQADLLIPFSQWAAMLLVNVATVASSKVIPVHVGMDLDQWPRVVRTRDNGNGRLKILFVGGEFERKGGSHLLSAFVSQLSEVAELHMVTRSAPEKLPSHVYVYKDLAPNDPELRRLYANADVFVHPTTSDLSPWVVLEAMASGCPVVTTRVGGIPELITEGVTGLFVEVGDVQGIALALRRLSSEPSFMRSMGDNARLFVEQHFNAAVNVPKILSLMKAAADQARRARSRAPAPMI